MEQRTQFLLEPVDGTTEKDKQNRTKEKVEEFVLNMSILYDIKSQNDKYQALFSYNVMKLVCDMYKPFQWRSLYGMEKTGFSIWRLLSFYKLIQLDKYQGNFL